MTYTKKLLSKSSFMLVAVLLACSVCACTIGDDEQADEQLLGSAITMEAELIGNAYKSGMLMGDIDAVSAVAADKRDTVRHSNISTYITASTMRIGDFPCQEILRHLPGAATEAPASVDINYIRESLPAAFNHRTDCLKMEVTSAVMEFDANMNGSRSTVRAEFTVSDGKMKYEQLIHWKYHFVMLLSTLYVDGAPVESYNSMPDNTKLVYVYNSWIMNYNVF